MSCGTSKTTRAEEPAAEARAETDALQLKASLLELIERHWLAPGRRSNRRASGQTKKSNLTVLRPSMMRSRGPTAGELDRTVAVRDAEIQRLQERIAALEAENEDLSERLRHEVDSRRSELRSCAPHSASSRRSPISC